MGVQGSLLEGSLRSLAIIFREECFYSPGRKKPGEEEGSGSWVCGSALTSWGTGWWLVVLGSVIVPQPHLPIISVFCWKHRRAVVQKRGGPKSENLDSVKVSELLWRAQGSR